MYPNGADFCETREGEVQTKLWLWRLQYNVGTWEGGGLSLCESGKESTFLSVTSSL